MAGAARLAARAPARACPGGLPPAAAAAGGGEVVWKTLGNGGNNELAEACVCSPLQHDDDVLLLQSPHNLIPWLMSNKDFSRQIFGTFGHDVVGSIMRRCLKLKDDLQKK